MAGSRKLLTVGALGVASFALIGAGASATFSDSVNVEQTIAAGRMNMTIAGQNGWSTAGGKTLTLPSQSPVGSRFSTGPQLVIVTNNGTVDSRLASLVVTAPTNNDALADGLRVKIVPASLPKTPEFDGTLTEFTKSAAGIASVRLKIPAGESTAFTVEFYADDLPNSAQGGVVTPTFTISFKG